MAGLLPGGAEGADLGGLLDMERLAGLVVLQRRTLQVHAKLGSPDRRGVGAGPPPDPVTQARRIRLEAQRAGRIWKHRPRVRLRETLAAQHVEEHLRMLPAHVGVAPVFGRPVTEIAPAIDHLLGRAPADPELQPPAGDEIGGARVFGHVKRVLVAHIDDGRSDLDAAGFGADGCQQRKRRGELAGEMMDTEVGPVSTEILGRLGQIDGLQQRIGRRACLRLR